MDNNDLGVFAGISLPKEIVSNGIVFMRRGNNIEVLLKKNLSFKCSMTSEQLIDFLISLANLQEGIAVFREGEGQ